MPQTRFLAGLCRDESVTTTAIRVQNGAMIVTVRVVVWCSKPFAYFLVQVQ